MEDADHRASNNNKIFIYGLEHFYTFFILFFVVAVREVGVILLHFPLTRIETHTICMEKLSHGKFIIANKCVCEKLHSFCLLLFFVWKNTAAQGNKLRVEL